MAELRPAGSNKPNALGGLLLPAGLSLFALVLAQQSPLQRLSAERREVSALYTFLGFLSPIYDIHMHSRHSLLHARLPGICCS